MFELEYKGGNTVVIATKKTTIVSDPNREVFGLKPVPVKGVVELLTEDRFRVDDTEAHLVIDMPGEYEVGDFTIKGVATRRHLDAEDSPKLANAYRIETEDIRMALLGNVEAKMDETILESLGVVDILVLPVGGGGYTLDATAAAAFVRQIEPKVVVPVHYAENGLSYEVPQTELEVFTKELGAPVEEPVAKLKYKAASSLPAALTVVPVSRT